MLANVVGRQRRVVNQRHHRRHDLAQVVRRNVRRHADRDAARPVHHQVREPARKHCRLLEAIVVVRDVVDGVLFDVGQHLGRDARQPRLSIPVGRGAVAVHRAKVSLAIHKRVAQREVLHHAHHRVVHRAVAMRVVLAEHVADHRGGLLVAATGHEAQFVHRVQNPSVHRLESVAHIWQRATDDDAHRIVDERLANLVVNEPRENPFAVVRSGHFLDGKRGVRAAVTERGNLPISPRQINDFKPP